MSFTIFQNEKTPLQAIKIRTSKSRKIDIFQKCLTHGLGPKMALFPTLFCQAILASKMSFTIFQIKKETFQAIKTRSSSSRKIDIFQRVQPMVFVQKWSFFQLFFFSAIQAGKMSFTIFQNEKTPFYAIKTRSSRSQKIDIFPKGLTHGFGPKMDNFQTFFCKAIEGRKLSFTIFQNEKKPFQAIKTRSS